ncbi:MAG: hypothetical protein IKP47_04290 [Ruminococcus sp.]|nr:hypothetical protein [Ruminococcus sp.]
MLLNIFDLKFIMNYNSRPTRSGCCIMLLLSASEGSMPHIIGNTAISPCLFGAITAAVSAGRIANNTAVSGHFACAHDPVPLYFEAPYIHSL